MLSGALVFFGLAYVAYLFWFSLVLWQAKDGTKWLFGAKSQRASMDPVGPAHDRAPRFASPSIAHSTWPVPNWSAHSWTKSPRLFI